MIHFDCAKLQDEQMDPSVKETYMGEWKNDKRTGFGVSERSDGLKYEGEWYNNKKYGYGVTTFSNGEKEEGKYKNNVLITNPKKKHLFLVRSAKFRERIDAAVGAAQRASKIALQKADIAISRTATARVKAEQADIAAAHAREDSDVAMSVAKKYAPDFKQPGLEKLRALREKYRDKYADINPFNQKEYALSSDGIDGKNPADQANQIGNQIPNEIPKDLPRQMLNQISKSIANQLHNKLPLSHAQGQTPNHQPPNQLGAQTPNSNNPNTAYYNQSYDKPENYQGTGNTFRQQIPNNVQQLPNAPSVNSPYPHAPNALGPQVNSSPGYQHVNSPAGQAPQPAGQFTPASTTAAVNTNDQVNNEPNLSVRNSLPTSDPSQINSIRRQSRRVSGDRPYLQTQQSSIDHFDHYKRPPSRDCSVDR